MAIIITLGVLGLAVVATPLVTRLLGRNSGWPLAGLYLIASATLAPAAASALAGESPTWSIPWAPALGIDLSFKLDGLGVVFGYIALLIGAAVFAYSTRYLEAGRQLSFYLVMTTFTLSMLALVLAANLVVLFIAWELTSLASFLLIARSGHYGEAPAMRTLLMTFIGGLFLLAATGLIWARVGATDLDAVFSSTIWVDDPAFTTLVAALVAIAAFTKSAQFPFHVWLPDAMAAITPVSAYLHAAAVVKAGIFLLLRFSPLFHDNQLWNTLLIGIGLFTSCIGAWFAISQSDLKRLMAYSTVSQLGLIVATIGVGTEAALAAAVLHTIAHALFKSGLFMMVGVVDHATHTRDLHRLPPNLYRKMPVSFALTILGCASMAGIPPMLGFISKEAILAAMLDAPGANWSGWAAFVVVAAGAVLTFTYCTKIVLGTFVDGTDPDRKVGHLDPWLVGTAGLPIVVSLPLAFVVWVLDPLVAQAAAAAMGAPADHVHLAMWHGFNLELLVSALIIAAGTAIAFKRKQLFAWAEANQFPYTGAEAIAGLTNGLRWVGKRLERLAASDAPTRHLLFILGSLAAVSIGGVCVLLGIGLPAPVRGLTQPIDVLMFVLITIAVLALCWSRSRLGAAVSLSAVGIMATVQIVALGAPDVALTQLLVESLSIIVIMLVLQRLPRRFSRPIKANRQFSILIAILVGAGVAGLVWALNGRRGPSAISEYYLDQTYEISGGYNVVNVILVEFRGLDTMGELSVLGMAGIAIMAVLSTVRDKLLDPADDLPETRPFLPLKGGPGSTAYRAITESWSNVMGLQLMLRPFNPILIVISALLFFRGHYSPGGGFIAALVAAAAIGLTYLSTAHDRPVGPPWLSLALIGAGIMTATGIGLVALAVEGYFLEPLHWVIFSEHISSSVVFDLGVYLAVVGLMVVAFNLLGTTRDSREGTRERADETVEGKLPGPLDTVRGEHPNRRPTPATRFLAEGKPTRRARR